MNFTVVTETTGQDSLNFLLPIRNQLTSATSSFLVPAACRRKAYSNLKPTPPRCFGGQSLPLTQDLTQFFLSWIFTLPCSSGCILLSSNHAQTTLVLITKQWTPLSSLATLPHPTTFISLLPLTAKHLEGVVSSHCLYFLTSQSLHSLL